MNMYIDLGKTWHLTSHNECANLPSMSTESFSTNEVIAMNVKRLRGSFQWTQQELSVEVALSGLRTWTRDTVADVEASRRKVSIDELVVLAHVFKTAPWALLQPPYGDSELVFTSELRVMSVDVSTALSLGTSFLTPSRTDELKRLRIELEAIFVESHECIREGTTASNERAGRLAEEAQLKIKEVLELEANPVSEKRGKSEGVEILC